MPDERPENARQIALIILDVCAHQLAVRKLLYDAKLATENDYQKAYSWAYESQLDVFRESLEKGDAAKVRAILEALRKTPHRI